MRDEEIIRDIHYKVGEIRGTVKGIAAAMDKHDKRIGDVEKKVWWFSGIASFIAFLATKFTGQH